jgi:hypothetical protein
VQGAPFAEVMYKARPSLMNIEYGLFMKACNHELMAEIGLLLYSTWQHDEEWIPELLSSLMKEKNRT